MRVALKRGYPAAFESLSTQTGNVVDIDAGTGRLAAKRRRAIFAVRLYRPFMPTHPNGHIWHDVSLRDSPLEAQEKSYPNCTFWDALDCVGHIPQAMQKLGIYFEHQVDEENDEDVRRAKEMRLARLRVQRGAWRIA